jgi:hypothetical protein
MRSASKEDEELAELAAEMPDTLAAIHALKQYMPGVQEVPPVVLHHQLHSIVQNRTQVEEELAALRAQHKVRIITLRSAVSDVGVVLTEDYIARLRYERAKPGTTDAQQRALEAFEHWILQDDSVSVTDAKLMQPPASSPLPPLLEEEIKYLVSAGFLLPRREIHESGVYWLTLPEIGRLTTLIVAARKEITSRIKRTQRKEVLERNFTKAKLKSSPIGWEYHIRDAAGAGMIDRLPSTVGFILRFVDDSAAAVKRTRTR